LSKFVHFSTKNPRFDIFQTKISLFSEHFQHINKHFSTKKFACGASFCIDSRIFKKFSSKSKISERFPLKNKHFSNNFSPAALVIALTQGFQPNFRRKSKISERFSLKNECFSAKKFSRLSARKTGG
jgi:hypothetical protein